MRKTRRLRCEGSTTGFPAGGPPLGPPLRRREPGPPALRVPALRWRALWRPAALVLAVVTAGVLLGPRAWAQEAIEGTWTSRLRERPASDETLQLRLELETGRRSSSWGFRVPISDLDGLDAPAAAGDVADASFQLVREAGRIAFEGTIRDGRGSGRFRFEPDSGFVDTMGRFGFAELSSRQLLAMTVQDVTVDWVERLRGLGYTALDTDELLSMAIHGVSAEFIEAFNGLGYRDIPVDQLLQLRIHGVSPEFVRDVRRALSG